MGMRRWEQADIDLAGASETAAAVADADEDGMEEWRREEKRKTPGPGHR